MYFLDPVRKQYKEFVKKFRQTLEVDLEWYYRRGKILADKRLTSFEDEEQGQQHDTTFKEFLTLLRQDTYFSELIYDLYGKESALSKVPWDVSGNHWVNFEVDGSKWKILGKPNILAYLHLQAGKTWSLRIG